MPRRKFVEIAIYNNLIQRTKRRCITIYIYIHRDQSFGSLTKRVVGLLEKRRCDFSFSKDTTFFSLFQRFIPFLLNISTFVPCSLSLHTISFHLFSIGENSIAIYISMILNRFVSWSTCIAFRFGT